MIHCKSLVLLGVVLTIVCLGVNADDELIISSPHVTNWGDWGEIDRCPVGSLVFGYRMKIQGPGGVLIDDTALNGIELLCVSAAKRINATQTKEFTTISSSVGHKGDYGNILECPEPGFAVGFQLRSEPNQLLYDDSGAVNLRLMCSTGETLSGYEEPTFGDWTEPQRCPRSTHICGIQTQVEKEGATDETTLNNVNMVCCQ